MAVRLDARDGLLSDVAALVVRDEAALAEPRLVGQDGLGQLEAPAGDARGDAQRLETFELREAVAPAERSAANFV